MMPSRHLWHWPGVMYTDTGPCPMKMACGVSRKMDWDTRCVGDVTGLYFFIDSDVVEGMDLMSWK